MCVRVSQKEKNETLQAFVIYYVDEAMTIFYLNKMHNT